MGKDCFWVRKHRAKRFQSSGRGTQKLWESNTSVWLARGPSSRQHTALGEQKTHFFRDRLPQQFYPCSPRQEKATLLLFPGWCVFTSQRSYAINKARLGLAKVDGKFQRKCLCMVSVCLEIFVALAKRRSRCVNKQNKLESS